MGHANEREFHSFGFLLWVILILFIVSRSTLANTYLSTVAQQNVGLCVRDGISRCCKDFYKQNNVCIECPPGTHGINCSEKCQPGYYGRICLSTCNCSTEEKCDQVKGCVDFSNIDPGEECIDGRCHKEGPMNNTEATKGKDNNDGNSVVTIVFITIGMVTALFILMILLIRKDIRSAKTSLFGNVLKGICWRRPNSSLESNHQIPENRNGIEDVNVYDDIRLSRMISGCQAQCETTTENCNTQPRYQDPTFLRSGRIHQEAVEYSRFYKAKSNVYNKISLRNNNTDRVNCTYDQFSRSETNIVMEYDGAYGGGCHFKSLAVCKEESESENVSLLMSSSNMADPLSRTQIEIDDERGYAMAKALNDSKLSDETSSNNMEEKYEQGQYYVLEKVESYQPGETSTTKAKGKSGTLNKMFGKLPKFQFKH